MDKASCFVLISASAALIFASSLAAIADFASSSADDTALIADISSMGRSFRGGLILQKEVV